MRDPLTRRFFLLRDEEYALATLLDGQRSSEEIGTQFEQEWAPLGFHPARFQAFVARLHRDGLLLDDSLGQARVLDQRRRQQRRQAWLQAPAQLLAVRIPGVNPQPFLDAVYPWIRWCFSPWAVVAALTLLASALLVVLLHPAELQQGLSDLQAWMGPRQVAWIAVILAATKVLHELGHAFACRHFGGECRELGLLLLVFTPCLYCDVSDAWLIRDRWRRSVVALAGMYVEMVLAAICTLVWWRNGTGDTARACLLVMSVCGVSTLVFNANPLLRYDGYFLVSDWCDVPNLWQRSRAVLRTLAARWLWGFPAGEDDGYRPATRLLLAAYALVSGIYRAVLLASCLVLVWRLLASWKLAVLGQGVALATLTTALLGPVMLSWQRLRDPIWRRRVRRPRLLATSLVGALLLLTAFLVPFPSGVRGPALLTVEDAAPIYVMLPGTVVEASAAGTRVTAGQQLLKLANPSLERELARWRGDAAVLEARVAALEGTRGTDPRAGDRLPAAREALAGTREVVAQRQLDWERLQLRAPFAGTLLAPPPRETPPRRTRELAGWTGSPLEEQQRGAWLENGTLVGWVGDPRRREASVYVDESDIELVQPGQSVRLTFAVWPGRVFHGTVRETAREIVTQLPKELTLAGELALTHSPDQPVRPLETLYQVRVVLAEDELPLINRVRGQARIAVASQSLFERVRRWIRSDWSTPE
ncbi:MAG: hypothetical protein U0935_00020 [Pirellulales bacterium]